MEESRTMVRGAGPRDTGAQREKFLVGLRRPGKGIEFVRFPECNDLFSGTGHPQTRENYLARTLGSLQRCLRWLDGQGNKVRGRHTEVNFDCSRLSQQPSPSSLGLYVGMSGA